MRVLHAATKVAVYSLFGLVCLQSAVADPVADARTAIMEGHYERAAEVLHPAAVSGNPTAQFILGNLYRRGTGVREDARTAALWYERAAQQGHLDAQMTLGELYYAGEGVPRNLATAQGWFRRAALSGRDLAPTPQYLLAAMLAKGEGGNRDVVTAHMWYSIAATNAVSPTTKQEYLQAAGTLENQMTPAQYQAARAKFRACLTSNYTTC
jgi:TPR repeat protein